MSPTTPPPFGKLRQAWVDPSGYSLELPSPDTLTPGDWSTLGLMAGMAVAGLATPSLIVGAPLILAMALVCGLNEMCRESMLGLSGQITALGSDVPNTYLYTAELLNHAFAQYPLLPNASPPTQFLANLALSLIGLDTVTDFATLVSGRDPLTGQELTSQELFYTWVALMIPFVGAGVARHYGDDIFGSMRHGDDLAHVASRTCSFDEATPVATDEGTIPIKDVEVGDKVLAWDELTDSTGYFLVTTTYTDVHEVLVYLTINGEQIETTPEHPFYTTDEGWTPASELNEGDALRTIDGTTGIVDAVTFVATPRVMYNMTVADAHTYVVGDGEWVVHNSCPILYRVEGIPNQRFAIDSAGNVTMMAGPAVKPHHRLYVSFDADHALYYLDLKVEGGLPGAHIKYFEVEQEFLDTIRRDKVDQDLGKLFPDRPQLSDVNQGSDLYGIPNNYFDLLLRLIIPGSGGVIYP
ncbi:MAG: polymorphic toxin-type HINT domain-containing protein [Caldilineaceae bacterium]